MFLLICVAIKIAVVLFHASVLPPNYLLAFLFNDVQRNLDLVLLFWILYACTLSLTREKFSLGGKVSTGLLVDSKQSPS